MKLFTEADCDKPITLPLGQEFGVSLYSVLPAEYLWKLESNCSTVVQHLRQECIQPQSAQLLGQGGREIHYFRGKQSGMITLHLKYAQDPLPNLEGEIVFALPITFTEG